MDRMVPEKETLTVEFKSDKKKYPDSDIFEAVVAFALLSNARRISNARICVRNAACVLNEALAVSDT